MKKILLSALLSVAISGTTISARVPAPIQSLVREDGAWVVENSAIKLYDLPSTGEIVIPGFLGAAICLVAFDHYSANTKKIAVCEEAAGDIAALKKEIIEFSPFLEAQIHHLPPLLAQKIRQEMGPDLKSLLESKKVNDFIDEVTNSFHLGKKELEASRSNIPYNIAFGAVGLACCVFSLYKYVQTKTHVGLSPVIAITPSSFTYDDKSILWNNIASITVSDDAKSLEISSRYSADVIKVSKFTSNYSLAELEILLKACLKVWCA